VFRKILNYATSGITNAVAKYAVRASVAIPFVFAVAFGLSGLTVVLINTYGYRDAYFLLAGGFAALGTIAGIAVWLKERSEEPENSPAIDPRSAAAVATAAVKTAKNMPPAFAAGKSGASSGFRDLIGLAARNWPLVLAAGIALLALGGPLSESRYDRRQRSSF
jgi:cytochrome bd-type quinol oxidase subunit 2